MIMKPVKSSNITHIGHDGDMMHVTYKSGNTYAFKDVSQEQHAELMSAESHGKHLAGMGLKGVKVEKGDA